MRYYQNISNVWCGCNRIEMDIAWYTKSPIWYTYVYILCVNNNPVHMQIDTWLFMNMHMLVVTLPSKHQHFFFADICLAAAKAATLCQGSNTDESRHSPRSTAESSASAFITRTAIWESRLPSGKLSITAIDMEFSHLTWWFSVAMWNYQRVSDKMSGDPREGTLVDHQKQQRFQVTTPKFHGV